MSFSRFLEARNDGIPHMAGTRDYFFWFSVFPVFLLSNKSCHSLSFRLCARQPSRLVAIGEDVGTFESHPPNVVVYELLHYNEQPCMLFILWSNLPSAVLEDAQSLSFATLAQKWVNDLTDFMETAAIDDWDSSPAGQLHIWYERTMKALRTSDPSLFLFDPTILSLRLVTHLQSTLLTHHNFAINKSGKSKTSVLILLDFIRNWKDELLTGISKNPAIIRGLLSPA